MQSKSFQEVTVQHQDFDLSYEYGLLQKQAPHAGAIVLFVGLVRELYPDQTNSNESKQTIDYIELTHYSGMTEKMCLQVVQEAKQRFSFDAVRIVHRVGKLYAGDQIVLVAIASRHRDASFEAAQYIMDYLKNRAPIWKKEVGARGEQWLGLKAKDASSLKRWAK